jgi:hypothetical protein
MGMKTVSAAVSEPHSGSYWWLPASTGLNNVHCNLDIMRIYRIHKNACSKEYS